MRRTVVIECPNCEGTGLLEGELTKEGAAIICHHCGGTGAQTVSYEAFEGRKLREGVIRVFQYPCGQVHYGNDITTQDGKVLHFSQYGCSYQDWLDGQKPIPMMELLCPYEVSNPCLGVGPCNRCAAGLTGYGPINECKFYGDKKSCWEEWMKTSNKEFIDQLVNKSSK